MPRPKLRPEKRLRPRRRGHYSWNSPHSCVRRTMSMSGVRAFNGGQSHGKNVVIPIRKLPRAAQPLERPIRDPKDTLSFFLPRNSKPSVRSLAFRYSKCTQRSSRCWVVCCHFIYYNSECVAFSLYYFPRSRTACFTHSLCYDSLVPIRR